MSSVPSSLSVSPVRVLTELDHVRIGKWLDAQDAPHRELQSVLDGADLVASEAMAPNVVTMRTRVQVDGHQPGETREFTLVYPDEVDPTQGRISVLSPVGTALLGRCVGDSVRWAAPDGSESVLRVQSIAFQPEASGELLR